MNDTNISNWTVDSSHERTFMKQTSYLPNKHSLLSPSKPLKPPKSPQKTQTHRQSTSFHSKHSNSNNNECKELELDHTSNATITSNDNITNLQIKNTQNTNTNTNLLSNNGHGSIHKLHKQMNKNISTSSHSDEGTPTNIHENNNNNKITSVSTYTNTYIHPLDRQSNKMDDIKDSEICETVSIASSNNNNINNIFGTKDNLLRNSLNDTIDYTKKLMSTIQSIEKDNNLKYKLRKYSMKIKKLETELFDEKKINENKNIFLEKVNNELNKTNIEIERIEREKRTLKLQLKSLEDIQQKYRLLEMKHLQLNQSSKIKDLETNKLNNELCEANNRINKLCEDRDNISAVSEVLREELINKKASIQRYKEIIKKLNNKLNMNNSMYMPNMNNNNKLSDTLYSIPDATKLYVKMNNFEQNIHKYNKDLQEKYNNQSREFMQIKLENQSIKNINIELSEKLNNTIQQMKNIKLTNKFELKQLKKQLISKNNDIQRLKTVCWNLNKFIANQTAPNMNNYGNMKGKYINNINNVTSLSFDHDLDLDLDLINDDLKLEFNKKNKKKIKSNKNKIKSMKSMKSETTDSMTNTNSTDFLDDITKVITNQKRNSKHKNKIKNIKNVKKNRDKNTKRQFIPNTNNNTIGSSISKSRRISLKKKNNENKDLSSTVKLASV